jgi:protein-S-isoprenylcysteine O-methyltransferase Ste14
MAGRTRTRASRRRPPAAAERWSRQRTYDRATVLLLLVGGLVVPFLGWLIGVGMLWAGPRWTAREKLLGTVVWPLGPGGLLLLFLLLPTSTQVCSRNPLNPTSQCTTSGWSVPSWLGTTVFLLVVVLGAAVAALLARRARRRRLTG